MLPSSLFSAARTARLLVLSRFDRIISVIRHLTNADSWASLVVEKTLPARAPDQIMDIGSDMTEGPQGQLIIFFPWFFLASFALDQRTKATS